MKNSTKNTRDTRKGLKMGETIKWLLSVLVALVIANGVVWLLVGIPVWRW